MMLLRKAYEDAVMEYGARDAGIVLEYLDTWSVGFFIDNVVHQLNLFY